MGDLSVPGSPLTVRRTMSAQAAQPHPHEVQDRELSLRQTATPGSEVVNPIRSYCLAGNTFLWLGRQEHSRRGPPASPRGAEKSRGGNAEARRQAAIANLGRQFRRVADDRARLRQGKRIDHRKPYRNYRLFPRPPTSSVSGCALATTMAIWPLLRCRRAMLTGFTRTEDAVAAIAEIRRVFQSNRVRL
jgi:hypothetical protein